MTDHLALAREHAEALEYPEVAIGSAVARHHQSAGICHAVIALAEAVRDLTLPQGPAETATPLADTPAPAEPPVFVEALPWATYVNPKPPQGSAAPPFPNGVEGAGAGLTEPVPTPAESSLVALNAAEEALLALLSWRDLDKVSEGDAIDKGVMRLRDEADRIAGLMRAVVAS